MKETVAGMSPVDLSHAVVKFYEGARAHAVGALLTRNDTISEGLRMIREALAAIDASDTGREILVPFLSHRDPMVRLEAARNLHGSRRDLATPVLLDLDLCDVTEASFCAQIFLILNGEPNKSSGDFAGHYPHRYDDHLYREALKRFESNSTI